MNLLVIFLSFCSFFVIMSFFCHFVTILSLFVIFVIDYIIDICHLSFIIFFICHFFGNLAAKWLELKFRPILISSALPFVAQRLSFIRICELWESSVRSDCNPSNEWISDRFQEAQGFSEELENRQQALLIVQTRVSFFLFKTGWAFARVLHSFPRAAGFRAGPWNLLSSPRNFYSGPLEFAEFCGNWRCPRISDNIDHVTSDAISDALIVYLTIIDSPSFSSAWLGY